jgi:hypothetical protein
MSERIKDAEIRIVGRKAFAEITLLLDADDIDFYLSLMPFNDGEHKKWADIQVWFDDVAPKRESIGR